jgi:hypothetical protein
MLAVMLNELLYMVRNGADRFQWRELPREFRPERGGALLFRTLHLYVFLGTGRSPVDRI